MSVPEQDLNERTSWTTLTCGNGQTLRTNSYDGYEAGCRFVAVLDADGAQLGWWPSEAWADPDRSTAVMSALWTSASGGGTVLDAEYGVELVVPLAGGEIRADPAGSYVRLLDATGAEVDGGSAYWTVEEWLADPELVMGAVLGAACALS